MSKICHLSRNRCSDEINKTVFLEQLPPNYRAILAMTDINDLSRLAAAAGKSDFYGSSQSIFVASVTIFLC